MFPFVSTGVLSAMTARVLPTSKPIHLPQIDTHHESGTRVASSQSRYDSDSPGKTEKIKKEARSCSGPSSLRELMWQVSISFAWCGGRSDAPSRQVSEHCTQRGRDQPPMRKIGTPSNQPLRLTLHQLWRAILLHGEPGRPRTYTLRTDTRLLP